MNASTCVALGGAQRAHLVRGRRSARASCRGTAAAAAGTACRRGTARRSRARSAMWCAAVRIVSLPTSGISDVGPELVEDPLQREEVAHGALHRRPPRRPRRRPSRSCRRRAASAARSRRRSAAPRAPSRCRRRPAASRSGRQIAPSVVGGAARERHVVDVVTAGAQLGARRAVELALLKLQGGEEEAHRARQAKRRPLVRWALAPRARPACIARVRSAVNDPDPRAQRH